MNNACVVTEGQVLKGRYRIDQRIGEGGMAVVFQAFDLERDEAIAIKVLSPAYLETEEFSRRFVREAAVTSRLNHPNIVRVHDLEADSGVEFMTMELLEGQTLRSEMNRRFESGESFALEEVRRLVRQIGDALGYAHLYTIHRDLKPENIWLTSEGQVKLVDFGLAALRDDVMPGLPGPTRTGVSFGTPYYIAPEQLSDPRQSTSTADQYSLAAVTYELLTGAVPAGIPKAVRRLRPDVPRSVSQAIRRGLSRFPEDRYDRLDDWVGSVCESRSVLEVLIASPSRLIAWSVIVFLVGVFSVLVLAEATARFQAAAVADSQRVSRVMQERQSQYNAWFEARGELDRIAADLQQLGGTNAVELSHSRVWEDLAQASNALVRSELPMATERLEALAGRLTELQENASHLAEMEALEAQRHWRETFDSKAPLLVPDLSHLADPDGLLAEGRQAKTRGDYPLALDSLRESKSVFEGWTEDLSSQLRRTEAFLSELPSRPQLYTNSVDMVFAALPEPDGAVPTTWISIWETRVIDYARFVADGENWDTKYSVNDLWRTASLPSPSAPVAGVSYSEALRFIQWLGGYESRFNDNELPRRITLVTDHVRGWIDTLLSEEEPIPESVHAFSSLWPPLRNEPFFRSDPWVKGPGGFVRSVATVRPNPLGLFDLSGNVWEYYVSLRETANPHWFDARVYLTTLMGGGRFGEVSISDQTQSGWPGMVPVKKVGRAEAIGFRLMYSPTNPIRRGWIKPRPVEGAVAR